MRYYDINKLKPQVNGDYLCRVTQTNGEAVYRVKRWMGTYGYFVNAPGYAVTHWMDMPRVSFEPIGRPSTPENSLMATLEAIDKFSNITKAARYLHLTRTAVSYRIKKLSELTGQRMVVSNKRGGTRLTKDGIEVLKQWQAVNST